MSQEIHRSKDRMITQANLETLINEHKKADC